jgi:hypothetical protein
VIHFFAKTLYSKVKAYLLGATGAAGLAGVVLWVLSGAGVDVSPALVGFVTSGAGIFVGLFVAYHTQETNQAVIDSVKGSPPEPPA